MKRVKLEHAGRHYRLGRGVDLSIPLDFHGPQPNAYGVPPARAEPYSGDGFVLDTRQGGPCNCDTLTFLPHCHGTHTECTGHISRERAAIAEAAPPGFLAATVISVSPHGREITADAIEVVKCDPRFVEALIVRTLPNDASKKARRWENDSTPYFTPDAMKAIRALGVEHLLVDLPSLDPILDYGKLLAHRVFWDTPPGSQEVPVHARSRTVTEMIFVPDDVPDGTYFLTIQLPRFLSDAAPSRPVLYFFEDES